MHRTLESHLFARKLMYLEANDLSQLMTLYAPHAIMIRLDTIMQGADAIQAFYRTFFEQFPDLWIKSVEHYSEAENIICGQMVVNSYVVDQHLYFVLLLQHGKIIYDIAVADANKALMWNVEP
jgi:hypothetical protein